MSNLKNDVTIKGAGAEYTLRPSFGALIAIEKVTKKSLLEIIDGVKVAQVSIADMIAVLKEGSKAAGTMMTDAEIQSLFEGEGIVRVLEQITPFFTAAFYGGKLHQAQIPKAIAEGAESQPQFIGTAI